MERFRLQVSVAWVTQPRAGVTACGQELEDWVVLQRQAAGHGPQALSRLCRRFRRKYEQQERKRRGAQRGRRYGRFVVRRGHVGVSCATRATRQTPQKLYTMHTAITSIVALDSRHPIKH